MTESRVGNQATGCAVAACCCSSLHECPNGPNEDHLKSSSPNAAIGANFPFSFSFTFISMWLQRSEHSDHISRFRTTTTDRWRWMIYQIDCVIISASGTTDSQSWTDGRATVGPLSPRPTPLWPRDLATMRGNWSGARATNIIDKCTRRPPIDSFMGLWVKKCTTSLVQDRLPLAQRANNSDTFGCFFLRFLSPLLAG